MASWNVTEPHQEKSLSLDILGLDGFRSKVNPFLLADPHPLRLNQHNQHLSSSHLSPCNMCMFENEICRTKNTDRVNSNRLSSKGMQTIQADLSRSLLWSIIFPARLGLSEKRLPKKWWLIVILIFFHSNCHQLEYGIPNFRIAHTALFHLVPTWATASVTTLRSVHSRLLGDELEFVIRETLAHFKTSCGSVHHNQPFCSKIAGFYVHPSPRYGYLYGICMYWSIAMVPK